MVERLVWTSMSDGSFIFSSSSQTVALERADSDAVSLGNVAPQSRRCHCRTRRRRPECGRDSTVTVSRVHERRATEFLARRGPVIASLMRRTGPFHLTRPSTGHFAALAESILHQQLAGPAARAIHGRFIALLDGDLSDRKSTRLNSSHVEISYAVFCLKKKKKKKKK